jgi:hypothetical protein
VITRLSKGSRTEYSPHKENTMKKGHGFLFGFAGKAALCAAAIAAIFTLAGCPTDGDGDGGGNGGGIGPLPNGNLGTTLTITDEQVYAKTSNSSGLGYTYTAINENKTVTIGNGVTGTASITNGKLSVSITAAPSDLESMSSLISHHLGSSTYVTATPDDAQHKALFLNTGFNELFKDNDTSSLSGMNISGASESVSYVYVDKDVTITSTGKTSTQGAGTIKDNAFTLDLKTGWNAIYEKTSYSGTVSSYTMNSYTAVGNPALKWNYEEYEDED